jgi:hypothetical protein
VTDLIGLTLLTAAVVSQKLIDRPAPSDLDGVADFAAPVVPEPSAAAGAPPATARSAGPST